MYRGVSVTVLMTVVELQVALEERAGRNGIERYCTMGAVVQPKAE